jgi:hypothetical protein
VTPIGHVMCNTHHGIVDSNPFFHALLFPSLSPHITHTHTPTIRFTVWFLVLLVFLNTAGHLLCGIDSSLSDSSVDQRDHLRLEVAPRPAAHRAVCELVGLGTPASVAAGCLAAHGGTAAWGAFCLGDCGGSGGGTECARGCQVKAAVEAG